MTDTTSTRPQMGDEEITPAMREAGYKAVGRFHYAPEADQGWGEQAEFIYREMRRASLPHPTPKYTGK